MVISHCQINLKELQWQVQVIARLDDESLHNLSRDSHTHVLKNRDLGTCT